jgi:DNA invertase Pin-like site-specific DNA recombinase
VQPGDLIVVVALDRLARSKLDLLAILDRIGRAGAKFKSLRDAWADTSTPHGELMVTILAGLATFERHLISARTEEGKRRARQGQQARACYGEMCARRRRAA